MGPIGKHGVVHGKYDGFIFIFFKFEFEFDKKFLPGFNVAIFIDRRMDVPIFEVPLRIDHDKLNIL